MFINIRERSDKAEWLVNAKTTLAVIEQVYPSVKKCIAVDGTESIASNMLLIEIASHAKATFDYDMEPSIAGYEGFLEVIQSGIQKIEDAIRGDKSGRKKIMVGKESEIKEAIAEYTSEKFVYKNKEGDQELTIQLPGGANNISDLLSMVKKANNDTKIIFSKYQADANKFGKAVIGIYKKADKGEEVSLANLDNLIDIKPLETFSKSLEDKAKKDPKKIKLLTETDVRAVINTFKDIGETMTFLDKGLDSLYAYYRMYENFGDDVEDNIADGNGNSTSTMDERIDELSFVTLDYLKFAVATSQALEEALLKSVK